MGEAVKLIPEKFLAIKKEFESNVWNFKFDVGEAIIKAVRDAAVEMGRDLRNRTENIIDHLAQMEEELDEGMTAELVEKY